MNILCLQMIKQKDKLLYVFFLLLIPQIGKALLIDTLEFKPKSRRPFICLPDSFIFIPDSSDTLKTKIFAVNDSFFPAIRAKADLPINRSSKNDSFIYQNPKQPEKAITPTPIKDAVSSPAMPKWLKVLNWVGKINFKPLIKIWQFVFPDLKNNKDEEFWLLHGRYVFLMGTLAITATILLFLLTFTLMVTFRETGPDRVLDALYITMAFSYMTFVVGVILFISSLIMLVVGLIERRSKKNKHRNKK